MPFINADNAAELGRKSGEARREKAEAWGKAVSFLVPVPPNTHLIQEPDVARTIVELVKIVTEQIASTRELLNDCEYRIAPHHRAQLLKALDALIERKSKLLGIPDPGCLKPSSKPSRGQSYPTLDPRPIEPVAQPVIQPQAQPQSGPLAKPQA